MRKRYLDRTNESSERTRAHFIETYNDYLNNSLSSTLLIFKEKILDLKHRLIKELREEILEDIIETIKKSYEKKNLRAYTDFLIDIFKKISSIFDKSSEKTIILNSNDFKFFNSDPDLIRTHFRSDIKLKKSEDEFIGGFKIIQENGNVFYDYTIEKIVQKNEPLVERIFSQHIDESEINAIIQELKVFIQDQKSKIKEYLNKYDRI